MCQGRAGSDRNESSRMMRRISVLGVLAAVALGIAACTGSPSPSGGSSSNTAPAQPGSTTLPYAGAPKVAAPLPASVLSGDPCTSALTPEQITKAVGSDPELRPGNVAGIGPKCSWTDKQTTGQVLCRLQRGITSGVEWGVSKHATPIRCVESTSRHSGVSRCRARG
jgi:hypothetical protein